MIEIDAKSQRKLGRFGRSVFSMTDTLISRAVARKLYYIAGDYRAVAKAEAGPRFKVRRPKLPSAFKRYTAGKKLKDIRLGIFHRARQAPVFEYGGTNVGRPWLKVAVAPDALTADGRVKKRYRGRWPKDLHPYPVRGGILLVERVLGRGKKTLGKHIRNKPIFLLIKSTTIRPVLGFQTGFTSYLNRRTNNIISGVTLAVDTAIGEAIQNA